MRGSNSLDQCSSQKVKGGVRSADSSKLKYGNADLLIVNADKMRKYIQHADPSAPLNTKETGGAFMSLGIKTSVIFQMVCL